VRLSSPSDTAAVLVDSRRVERSMRLRGEYGRDEQVISWHITTKFCSARNSAPSRHEIGLQVFFGRPDPTAKLPSDSSVRIGERSLANGPRQDEPLLGRLGKPAPKRRPRSVRAGARRSSATAARPLTATPSRPAPTLPSPRAPGPGQR